MANANYIIDFYNFNADGNRLEENKIITSGSCTKSEAKEKARRNCKKCFGRGFLFFDHSQKNFSYTQYCTCVINKIEREEREIERVKETSHANVLDYGFNSKKKNAEGVWESIKVNPND